MQEPVDTFHPKPEPNKESASKDPLLIDAIFSATLPKERVSELIKLVETIGLAPEQVLIRVFDAEREALLRQFGTDRMGINTNDTRRTKWDKRYEDIIKKKGVTKEDVLHATWLEEDSGKNLGTSIFLDSTILTRSGHGYGVAIYDINKLEMLRIGNLPTDLYMFKDTANKKDALVGVVMEPKPKP
jgi:hypothetical protein